jgi:hypothetical protein
MISQAINTLRRAFESGIYGSFLATNSFHVGKNIENPFVRLIEKGFWSSRAGNRAIRFSQLTPIIKNIRSRNNISKKDAESRVLTGFVDHYLEHLCSPVCSDHYNKRKDLVCSLPKGSNTRCSECSRQDAKKVLVKYPVTMGVMIAVTHAKLRRKTDHR